MAPRTLDCGGSHLGEHRSKPLDPATGRIGYTCLLCNVDVVHTCSCAPDALGCAEGTPDGLHPIRVEPRG